MIRIPLSTLALALLLSVASSISAAEKKNQPIEKKTVNAPSVMALLKNRVSTNAPFGSGFG